MTMRTASLARVAILTAVLAACGGDSSGPPPTPPVPTTLAVVSGNDQTAVVGSALTLPLAVKVTDANGAPMRNVVVTFQVTSGGGSVIPASDSTDANGVAETRWTLGTTAAEQNRVQARVSSIATTVTFNAIATAGPAAALQKITQTVCGIPGASGARDIQVKVTDAFGNAIPQTRVDWSVSGGGSVNAPTSNTGTDGQASTRWTIGTDTPDQTLSASVAGLGPVVFSVRLATRRTVAVGGLLTLTGDDARCNDFPSSNARYLLTVANTAPDQTSTAPFALGGGFSVSAGNVAASPMVRAASRLPSAAMAEMAQQAQREAAMHTRIHQNNMDLIRSMPRIPASAREREQAQALAVQEPVPNFGDTLTIRMADPQRLSCATFLADIRARVVYVGTRGVLLEDVAAPLAGTMDSLYRAVGSEFDTVMYPILTTNFGDPLAFDAQLDNNQRFFMLFSQRINNIEGIAGYVLSTDFYPRASCTSSNAREMFYARVPTSPDAGFNADTRENWLRRTRTVIIHESKHLAAFAARFARANGNPSSADFEHTWLEEASAMMAEELWARTVFGYAQRGNTNYRSSIYCEVRPAGFPECVGKPRSLFDHFFLLHDYEVDIETLSPLGRTSTDDFTFYGSGWALLRWAVDHSSLSESAFLRAITNEFTQHGYLNLEARTGRTFADMLVDWTLTLALDDRPNFTPPRPQLTMPSWNMPDIFRSLAADFPTQCSGPCFSADPLDRHQIAYGEFSVNVADLRGGTASIFELSGSQAGRQLLELRSLTGGAPNSALRFSILRVE